MGTAGIERFVTPVTTHLEDAVSELADGRKQTHWMWFIFPQLRVLGRSDTARFYGLADLDEARQLLDHPVLGPAYERAVAAAHAAVVEGDLDVHRLFGTPDDLKLVSSLTLFEAAALDAGRGELLEQCRQLLAVAERQGFSRCSATRLEIEPDASG